METNPHRIEEFRQEIAGLNIRTPADEAERLWLIAGMVCIGVAIVVIAFTWFQVSGEKLVALQLPYLASGGLLSLTLVIVGCALFVRYSLTRYLRFWLVRYIYEDRAQTDREVETLERIEALLQSAVRPRQPQ